MTNILEILAKKYMKDNSAELTKIVTTISKTKKDVDALQKALISVKETDILGIKKIAKQLAGCNHFVKTLADKIHALRHNKRVAFRYLRAKEYDNHQVLDKDNNPIKGTDKRVDSEADLFVSQERDVYYMLNGIVAGISTSLSWSQSHIKGLEQDNNRTGLED